MCTVDDSDVNEVVNIPTDEKINDAESHNCRKCNLSKGDVVLRGKDVYCKSCFVPYVTHKFRASLGKSKLMRPTDHVLVSFSGGQSSTALLHMLWMGTKEEDHKKLLYKISFLYIDEGLILNEDNKSRRESINTVKHLVEIYDFKFYATTLSKALQSDVTILNDDLIFDEATDRSLEKLFKETDSLTSREDLLQTLRRNLLFAAAKEIGCNKIFTAENQTNLAVKLLTSIALGRGEQLAAEVGFQDSRSCGTLLLRPMRDLDRKEIAYYNLFNQLPLRQHASLTSGKPKNSSIKKLTEDFVSGLHRDFPSTVSTIFRIGEKLKVSNTSNAESEDVCLLCQGSILKDDTDSEHPYSASGATLFSQSVSCVKKQKSAKENSSCGSCDCGMQKDHFTLDEIQIYFCYGCLLILKELGSLSLLPQSIIEEIKRRQSLNSMRNQIAEFLL